METKTKFVIRIKKDAKVRYAGHYLLYSVVWSTNPDIFCADTFRNEEAALAALQTVGDPYLEVVPMTVILPE
jgi:hypothetical protein